jgi:ribosomal protein S18 acetylase RimI-like enzyme
MLHARHGRSFSGAAHDLVQPSRRSVPSDWPPTGDSGASSVRSDDHRVDLVTTPIVSAPSVRHRPGGLGRSDGDTISAMPTIAVLDHHDREQAGRIRDLQRAAYAVEAQLIGYSQMPPLVETTRDIAQLDLIVLGAVERETLRGLLGYRRDGDVVDIDRLAVDPDNFRNGIGRALLEELHRRESDADRFEVSTGAANEPAIALYRAVGYRLKRQEISCGVRLVHLERATATAGPAGLCSRDRRETNSDDRDELA